MTYIEFFDKSATENVCSCLAHTPDRVIFIGEDEELMKTHIGYYKRVFSDRDEEIDFSYDVITENDLDGIVSRLSAIVKAYDDCVFDITGGQEVFLLALGVVYANFPHRNIQIHKFNLEDKAIYDLDKDGNTIYREMPELTIEENVRIYGGDVAYGEINEPKTYKWKMNSEFLNDIETIWTICKGNVKFWNAVIGTFNVIETIGNVESTEPLTTKASKSAVMSYLEQHRLQYKINWKIVKTFLQKNLLLYFDDCGEIITVTYKNPQVKKCLTIAGQALEMKIYATARNLRNDDGTCVYNDAMTGVLIDWDGEFHDENIENEYDTENEIDILLMHGVVPVFVSCKNGIVTAEELYKLNTVAQRFGGKYSKKVLIATAISKLGEKGEYLRQRAGDMNIRIVENVQDMDKIALENILKNLWDEDYEQEITEQEQTESPIIH